MAGGEEEEEADSFICADGYLSGAAPPLASGLHAGLCQPANRCATFLPFASAVAFFPGAGPGSWRRRRLPLWAGRPLKGCCHLCTAQPCRSCVCCVLPHAVVPWRCSNDAEDEGVQVEEQEGEDMQLDAEGAQGSGGGIHAHCLLGVPAPLLPPACGLARRPPARDG
jgi:hypothetical protein